MKLGYNVEYIGADYLIVHHMEPDHSALIAEPLTIWSRLKTSDIPALEVLADAILAA